MCTESRRSQGFTLVELIVFIVIVSVAVAGVLLAVNYSTAHSVDSLMRKQALAVAEAVLEEAMLKPYTWCDPDDPQAPTALSAAVGATGCTGTTTVESSGPETGEVRTNFDNVNDYHGLNTTVPIEGAGAAPYSAAVTVAATTLNDITVADNAALLITVTVNAPGGESVVLQGIRTRHSPNLLP